MQVVIEIPEDRFNSIKHFGIKQNEVYMLEKSLISGKLLQKGHWINDRNKNNVRCSVCGRGYKDVCATASITSYSYCPNCGCRMVEPQESEG